MLGSSAPTVLARGYRRFKMVSTEVYTDGGWNGFRSWNRKAVKAELSWLVTFGVLVGGTLEIFVDSHGGRSRFAQW